MSLNIKDPEVHALASELASYTGETLTRAVKTAVQERLVRQKNSRRGKKDMVEDLLAIGRSAAAKLKGPPIDHAEFLYDERGLPK